MEGRFMIPSVFDEAGLIAVFWRRAIVVLAFVFLGTCLWFGLHREGAGIDFYQYWGIGLGPRLSEGALKSPYANLPGYAAFLDARAGQSGDPMLRAVHEKARALYRAGLDIPGTPLQYAAFAGAPSDYATAQGLYLALQLIVLIGSMLVFLFLVPKKRPLSLALAGLLLLGNVPVRGDLYSGNIAIFQLVAFAALAVFYDKALRKRAAAYGLSAVFMSALAVLTLFKPNFALVSAALAAALWSLQGTKVFFVSFLCALVAGVLAGALACLSFDAWSLWADWAAYVAKVGDTIPYSLSRGNDSTSLLVARTLDIDIRSTLALMALALAGHCSWTLFRTLRGDQPFFRQASARLALFIRDPFFCTAFAITATLALAPLVWSHYYVLSLFPVLWLLAISPSWSGVELLALAAFFLPSGIAPTLSGAPDFHPYAVSCGWIPLWFALQSTMAQRVRMNEKALCISGKTRGS